ncbi:hypothetical protein RDI58_029043 [Solanum bulbocastanum]|uniref:Uncharacterized protein n=1 Tax=Solanum bulbocastanum TaxID=147425 RepID=A0AAN8SSZ3_SOLBU
MGVLVQTSSARKLPYNISIITQFT